MCRCTWSGAFVLWTPDAALLPSLKWLAGQEGFSCTVGCASAFSSSCSKEHENKIDTCYYLILLEYPLTFPCQVFEKQLVIFYLCSRKKSSSLLNQKRCFPHPDIRVAGLHFEDICMITFSYRELFQRLRAPWKFILCFLSNSFIYCIY